MTRQTYEALRQALHAAGLDYVFVELTASAELLRERLAARSEKAPAGSDARLEDFDVLTERYRAPDALEDARHVQIGTEPEPGQTTQALLEALIRLNEA